ncbi:lariat debranching enzyme [Coccinella septempunctata]|uniref:lariat debranching enzyme n=1 Tax=Coccinella septempunctata TaxID=41139 RepID=UPI001D063785|nr:lariat debranching enzyme [Coccinella septempunctata]
MKIAVEGCAHGELEKIYDTIKCLEERENIKVDLLLCCGDFQTSRNEEDLRCMAVPPKYYDLCSFYKYYSGEKIAPILTVLIGGNHEASNYLQELPYGGWVAPRIYYMGYAGVINVGGVKIGGISGIYKKGDFMKGHFEICPYDNSTKRSVYHIRNLEIFRLKQVTEPIDIFLSHDWPTNVTDYGNKEQLIRFKPHFKDDIEMRKLGSKPCEDLLNTLKPKYWFSAHLHCKFAALIPHQNETVTKFLALDKCLPKRRFLQVFDVPHDENEEIKINYDLEWLTILMTTNHLLSVKPETNSMPGPYSDERNCFKPTEEEKNIILSKLSNNLTVPENFVQTMKPYDVNSSNKVQLEQPGPLQNPQTTYLCKLLNIDDPIELILKNNDQNFSESNLSLKTNHSSSNVVNSDCDLEETSDEPSFINDTIVEDSPPQTKRSILCLPEPKNDSNDLFFIDTEPSSCDNSWKRKSQESVDVKDEIVSCKPDQKKFKRRNFNIYGSGDNS